MTPQAAIEAAIANCQMVVDLYLSDLTEEETMHRPGEGLNHIRWQLGHLIVSEHKFMDHVAPGSVPTLPDGFADRYRKETATIDDASQFDRVVGRCIRADDDAVEAAVGGKGLSSRFGLGAGYSPNSKRRGELDPFRVDVNAENVTSRCCGDLNRQ